MVGRTPEYLGKKIGGGETRWTVLYALLTPLVVLALTGIAVVTNAGLAGLGTNSGPRGFTEILFAYASCMANNGQTMAGLNANTVFYNVTTTIAMLAGRYGLAALALALAGRFAAQRRVPTDPSRDRGRCDRIQARGRRRRRGRSDRYRSAGGDRFKRRCPARESPSRERIRGNREPGATQFRQSGDVAALRGGIGNRAASDCSGLLWPSGKELRVWRSCGRGTAYPCSAVDGPFGRVLTCSAIRLSVSPYKSWTPRCTPWAEYC
jgi:hypothetical protein